MITQGGFYIGDFTYSNGETFGLVISEKKYEIEDQWTESYFQTRTTDDDGYMNTIMMNSKNVSPIAKHILSLNIDGYGDWYIPSRKELYFIYKNKDKLPNEYNFKNDYYWSSTQFSSTTSYAWIRYFSNGNEYNSSKHNTYYVGAIRKFKI